MDLMFKFKEGDEKSFNEIVKNYKNKIFNFIYRFIHNYNDSEDILQEVFIKIYKSKDNYISLNKFENYLYKIASNLCKDFYKKKNILKLDNNLENYNFNTKVTPLETYIDKEKEEFIRDCILDLPYKQRVVFILVTYENKSYKEISEITGYSIKSIKSLIFRARQKLKDLLKSQLL